ncbi:MAG: DUF3187 family protein [Candidatus Muiribacteriaceae bacterium]
MTYSWESWGPINYHISSPLRGLKNEMFFLNPTGIPPGKSQINISHSWINIWNYKKDYFKIDMEVLSSDVMISTGLKNNQVIHVNLPFYYISGGALDSTIEKFHSSIGITNANREVSPHNDIAYWIKDRQGNEFSVSRKYLRGLDMGHANIIYQKIHGLGSPLRKSFAVNIKAPVSPAEKLFESWRTDVTVSYTWTYRTGKNINHLTFGVTDFGSDTLDNIKLRDLNKSLFYAIEIPLGNNKRKIIQLLINEKLTDDIPKFDRPTYIVNWGYKIKRRNTIFTFSIIENILQFDNSPDIGFFAGRSFQ